MPDLSVLPPNATILLWKGKHLDADLIVATSEEDIAESERARTDTTRVYYHMSSFDYYAKGFATVQPTADGVLALLEVLSKEYTQGILEDRKNGAFRNNTIQ